MAAQSASNDGQRQHAVAVAPEHQDGHLAAAQRGQFGREVGPAGQRPDLGEGEGVGEGVPQEVLADGLDEAVAVA